MLLKVIKKFNRKDKERFFLHFEENGSIIECPIDFVRDEKGLIKNKEDIVRMSRIYNACVWEYDTNDENPISIR